MAAKKRKNKLLVLLIIVSLLVVIILIGNHFYQRILAPSVKLDRQEAFLKIPSGADFRTIKDSLHAKRWIRDTGDFAWVARKMNLPNHVYAGKYRVENGMSNKALVELLRSGKDEPVRLTIRPFESLSGLAGQVGDRIEADSSRLMTFLTSENYQEKLGFNEATILCLFIPNTYEFYWNTQAQEFLKKMKEEYEAFWNSTRKQKAEQYDLHPTEVQTLASIIQKESSKPAEWDTMAGVYLNRLEKGIALQADPTLKYILKKKGKEVKRIYNKHKKLASPYNTYKNRGLPPGPLVAPQTRAIEAVLNAVNHDYYYFVAKPDFSGYHHFSETLRQHNRYARKYQQTLNEKDIR